MPRAITLLSLNDQGVVGNATLPEDFPGIPDLIEWEGRLFLAGDPSFSPAPGEYETYNEVSAPLKLAKNAVVAPDKVPPGANT